MYFKRTLEEKIKSLSNQFKVILVTGARQVGKSTILKHCDPERNYVTLDDYDNRLLANNDPKLFLQNYKPPLIIDEIQYAPNLLSYIKINVDNSDKKGQYWLTGSQQFRMMKNASESLAGRVAIIDLSGLSLKELDQSTQIPFLPTQEYIETAKKYSKLYDVSGIYDVIWRGQYPEINANKETDWNYFYGSYVQTYIERDIKDLKVVRNELMFMQFLKLAAARTGQLLNYADIAHDLGVPLMTVKSWISILVSSNIAFLLPPYFANLNKRIVKTPKFYFKDTGLCSYLIGWQNPKVLENGAMAGAIFETFVVNEIIKSYIYNSFTPNIYYYRDSNKKEIDILIEQNAKLYPVEIKKTASPNSSMTKSFSLIPQERIANGAIVCLASDCMPVAENVSAIPVGYI